MKTNYLAIFVAALAYWILGAVWFGVVFGARWMVLENITEAQLQRMNPAFHYVISFLLDILIAFVLSQICLWRSANTAGRGAAIGVLLWVGIVGPMTWTNYMYEMRSKELFAINEFYPLAGLVLMGTILGAWTKKAA